MEELLLRSANQGFTVVIKDNIASVELPTTCASKILKGFVPSENATVTKLLESAGMVTIAKTNMDEFGMGSHSTNSAFGAVVNGEAAKKYQLSAGGSSGGSALAVARDLAHIGIGTDTGGSIRLPAAYMSLVGFKPSYGLISRVGVVPYANSLDTVGILAKSPLDTRLTYDFLSQPDERDPTCLDRNSRERIRAAKHKRRRVVLASKLFIRRVYHAPYGRFTNEVASSASRNRNRDVLYSQKYYTRRIGVPLEYNVAEMHPLVRWAWTATLSHLRNHYRFEIVPISLPSTKHALSAYYVLAPAEASSNLAKYDGVRYGQARTASADADGGPLYSQYRYENFGAEVRRRILLGTYTLSAGAMDNYFIQAQKVRRLVQQDFDAVFRMPNPLRDNTEANIHGVDMIIVPTAPTPPPYVENLAHQKPVQRYMNDVFTVPASLAGLPAISVPAPAHPLHPWNPEVAIGMQVIGQYGDDFSVMYFAQNFLSNFHRADIRRTTESKMIR
ncbi:Trimeric GatFAB AmidoTransferase(AdT) complex subunit [Cladophialophora chaetospira]|uniref:Glutamyl-tRNA(Gln) amidotransferase subunit A, mitochondrial n=1 Tax=Cladophialophora chaetospira TaxID=386627 RepID=A0AA38XAQ0_9EURO|nr:Trimeric GatFAB AmidoTransferase(AdT) complex subunit [Cladophialophora chaetospira]